MREKPVMRRVRGLTLVELMVVVAVLAVLAGIAYPLYTAQTERARRADAKIALETIALAQERLYTLQGTYAGVLTSSTLQLSTALAGGNSEDGHYAIGLAGGGQTFTITATATGGQSSDTDCATFTINHLGQKTATDGGSTDCW
jgi:type IV pilus assembly protein PilE